MQLVSKLMKLLIFTAALFGIVIILTLIPPLNSPAQQPPAAKDTVLEKAKQVITRFEEVSAKVNYASAMVDSNSAKAKEIISLLDRLPVKRTVYVKSKPQTIVKKTTEIVEAPRDTTLYYTQGQYANRPILIFEACRYTYGGDTFRTDMWKAPGEEGLIKQIFRRKKKKTITNKN